MQKCETEIPNYGQTKYAGREMKLWTRVYGGEGSLRKLYDQIIYQRKLLSRYNDRSAKVCHVDRFHSIPVFVIRQKAIAHQHRGLYQKRIKHMFVNQCGLVWFEL